MRMLNDNNIYAIFGWAKEGKDRKGREKISVYTLFGQNIYIYIYGGKGKWVSDFSPCLQNIISPK